MPKAKTQKLSKKEEEVLDLSFNNSSSSPVGKTSLPKSSLMSNSSKRDKKIYFVMLFPELTQKEYENLPKNLNNEPKNITNNGFRMTFDPSVNYETYKKHYAEMKTATERHIRSVKKSYEKRNIPIEVKSISLPTNEKELEKVRQQLSQLQRTDELYLNSHGRPELIGNGGLTMEAYQVAKNIEHLGISKKTSPHIALWACNSAVPKNASESNDNNNNETDKVVAKPVSASLAGRVKSFLKREGFDSPLVTGTTNLLMYHDTKPTFVAKKTYNAKGKELKKKEPVKTEESLRSFATPTKDEKIKRDWALWKQGGGLFTHMRNITNAAAQKHQDSNTDYSPTVTRIKKPIQKKPNKATSSISIELNKSDNNNVLNITDNKKVLSTSDNNSTARNKKVSSASVSDNNNVVSTPNDNPNTATNDSKALRTNNKARQSNVGFYNNNQKQQKDTDKPVSTRTRSHTDQTKSKKY